MAVQFVATHEKTKLIHKSLTHKTYFKDLFQTCYCVHVIKHSMQVVLHPHCLVRFGFNLPIANINRSSLIVYGETDSIITKNI